MVYLGMSRRVSGPQEEVQAYRNWKLLSAWEGPAGRKGEHPWCWSLISELEGASSGYCFCILILLQGAILHGHGVAAGQHLVPIIRWELKRPPRVESAEFGQFEAARVALLAASCGA